MVKRLKIVVIAAAFIASFVSFSGAAQASAGDYAHAQYQVTLSLNCNNPSAPCQQIFGLGGIWGWIALLPDGRGTAQIADCGHSVGGNTGNTGAGHMAFDVTWEQFSSPNPPTPITPADPNGNYLNVANPVGLPPFPATYGHYAVSFMGARGQITIAP